MAIECGVITALLIVIMVVFLRKKRIPWAIATIPLMLVPFTEFVMDFLLWQLFSVQVSVFVRLIALLVAMAASCVWVGMSSMSFKSKKVRISYIAVCNIFDILLGIILIHYIIDEVPILHSLVQ